MGLSTIFSTILDSFLYWLSIFGISFTKYSTIWIIVPIWIAWFFAEFFQEKDGTSFGNAISNGAVPMWVGIDWIRQLTNQIVVDHAKFSFLFFTKYVVSVLAIIFGLIIVIEGIKGKNYIKFLGRIRVVTYLLAFFTPIVYGLINPSFRFFLVLLIYAPVFYFTIELIDKYTPRPKVVAIDQGLDKEKNDTSLTEDFKFSDLNNSNNNTFGSSSFGQNMHSNSFPQKNSQPMRHFSPNNSQQNTNNNFYQRKN